MQFYPFFGGTSPGQELFTDFGQYTPNVAGIPSWLARDVRSYPCPKIMSRIPTSFRRKTDGPHWAADAPDTPNPARISCADPPDRFIHICFFAIG